MPRQFESYEHAIQFLFGRINYERIPADNLSVRDFKLERMRRLLRLLGNPQETIPAVHIAGTKGKGSTAAMIASMLAEANLRVGLFTSPHITDFEERLTVNGEPPTPAQLVELVNVVAQAVIAMDRGPEFEHPTFFEVVTALGWLYFAQQRVDLAVLEVGLGGRLDSTNVCRPEVTVITNISRDHVDILGSELSQIAREKAGIVKPGVPLVSGVLHPEARPVIASKAAAMQAPLLQLGADFDFRYVPHAWESAKTTGIMADLDVEIGASRFEAIPLTLAGQHQGRNAALAVVTIEQLNGRGWHVPPDAVCRGMSAVRWPLRFEIISERPMLIVDAAHNRASVEALVATLGSLFPDRCRTLIFGATRDKDVAGMLRELLPLFSNIVFTQYRNNPRALPLDDLCKIARSLGVLPLHAASDPGIAWEQAVRLSEPDEVICGTGSLFIAAELRELVTTGKRSGTDSAVEV